METLNQLSWLFDCLLGIILLWLAWRVLTCSDLFKAVVLFIAFGLLMALVWVRLDAPDVALAEAAIGAGLTGALLLAALARLDSVSLDKETNTQSDTKQIATLYLKWLSAIALVLAACGLGYAVIVLAPNTAGLTANVTQQLDTSGVSNPVTAVLLNFRGYDTLLEMFVLLIAVLGVWSLGMTSLQRETTPGTVLDTLARLLTPLLILIAAYLLWVGADSPGGAFQAGSVLSAAGVLLLLTGRRLRTNLTSLPLRLVLVAGPVAFVAMAILGLLIEGQLLKYPPAQAGALILLVETVSTLSIAVTLATLFLGGSPKNDKDAT